jgi:hypothetical protein
MPDVWEYPWFAAWDSAFHCVALAHVDPAFAKYQLILLCREWFQHPDGALPAYEWAFDDVNPPVQAWAALEVYRIDGSRDREFLVRVFAKLLLNFTWWVNRQSLDDGNLFEGGFLGLDNIGPIDRSHMPAGWRLEQADGTGWMAFYTLSMLEIAAELGQGTNMLARDLAIKFVQHFVAITDAINRQGLWDEDDGFYYDRLVAPDGSRSAVPVRSMVGIVPLLGAVTVHEQQIIDLELFQKTFGRMLERRNIDRQILETAGFVLGDPGNRRFLFGIVPPPRLMRVFERLFDEGEFLSPHGLRSISAFHREHPVTIDLDGGSATVDYQPAESNTSMFGGNSNWRGPVWFPLNHLAISALERYGQHMGDSFTIEYPTGSGQRLTLSAVADDLRRRLISLFVPGEDGRRPCYGWVQRLQSDPDWNQHAMFNEYFHGDNGAGLGATHQTGWTGLVADLICRRPTNGGQP